MFVGGKSGAIAICEYPVGMIGNCHGSMTLPHVCALPYLYTYNKVLIFVIWLHMVPYGAMWGHVIHVVPYGWGHIEPCGAISGIPIDS